jgi:hypothetical protein
MFKDLPQYGVPQSDRAQLASYLDNYQGFANESQKVNANMKKIASGDTSVIGETATSISKVSTYDPEFANKYKNDLNDYVKINNIKQINTIFHYIIYHLFAYILNISVFSILFRSNSNAL